jgi:PAS domain S-box-containing protein
MMAMMQETPDGSELRRCAEEKLKEMSSRSEELSGESHERMATLIHELEVHQIELKMQNDELRRVQGELESTRDRYTHLYDFAPVGYFTVSEKEIIDEVNLTGAAMIGIERNLLIGKPFFRLVYKDDQKIFYKLRKALLETEKPQSCELRLVKKDGHEFHVCLECMVIKIRDDDLRQIRAAVSDITERKLAQAQRSKLITKLQKALSEVKTLRGFLPICANCKDIRNDKGYWEKIETYIHDRSDAEFSHSLCPVCAKELYPYMDIYDDNDEVAED